MSGQDLMIDKQIGYEVLPATLTRSPGAARPTSAEYERGGARRPERKRADEKLEENGKVWGE